MKFFKKFLFIYCKYKLNMENYIDLTFKSAIKDDEMRELLNKPGFYRIPITNYYNVFNNGPVFKDVEVVYVTPKNSRMLVIIVKIDEDTYQDFYYNGNEGLFKILTFNDFCEEEIDEDLIEEVGGIDKVFTMGASWIMEVVLVPCPEEFANYVVDRNIFKEHKFFADIFGNFNRN